MTTVTRASGETRAALEQSLKATTLQLSHILAYQARLQHLGTAHYAPPATRTASRQLAETVNHFDALCTQVQLRILRAIAVLERDIRRQNGVPPLPQMLAATNATASTTATSKSMPQPAPSDEAATANMPFSLPVSTSAAPPATATTAAPAPDSGPVVLDLTGDSTTTAGDAIMSTSPDLPFQLPTSGAAAPPPSISTATATAMSAPVDSHEAVPASFPDSTADDIDALLSSLNMPAFASSTSALSASLGTSSNPMPAATSLPFDLSSLSAPPGVGASGAFDYSSLLLDVAPPSSSSSSSAPVISTTGLGLDVLPPAPGQVSSAPSSSSAAVTSTSSRPATSTTSSSSFATSAGTAPPTSSSSGAPLPFAGAVPGSAAAAAPSSAASAPSAAPTEDFDFSSFDFASLGIGIPNSQPPPPHQASAPPSAAGSGNGNNPTAAAAPPPPLDFSILSSGTATGAGNAAGLPSMATTAMAADSTGAGVGGTDWTSMMTMPGGGTDMMDIDELLKSLGSAGGT